MSCREPRLVTQATWTTGQRATAHGVQLIPGTGSTAPLPSAQPSLCSPLNTKTPPWCPTAAQKGRRGWDPAWQESRRHTVVTGDILRLIHRISIETLLVMLLDTTR